MSDFNNGPGNDLNGNHRLAPRRLFEADVNNSPSQAITNPVPDRQNICSGLLLMVSWWVPYLSKSHMPNISMAQEVTRIMALFLVPWLFKSDSNNGASLGHSNAELQT